MSRRPRLSGSFFSWFPFLESVSPYSIGIYFLPGKKGAVIPLLVFYLEKGTSLKPVLVLILRASLLFIVGGLLCPHPILLPNPLSILIGCTPLLNRGLEYELKEV